MSTEHETASIDTRNMIYTSSSIASKGLMNFQRPSERPVEQETLRYSAIPVTPIIRQEIPVRTEAIQIQEVEAQAANLQAPAKLSANSSDKNGSETSSVTSYDSDKEKEKVTPVPSRQNVVIEQQEQKQVIAANTNQKGEPQGVVEVKGFGNRDHYLSEGYIVFKVLECKFRQNAKVDTKHKPYFKFRLGLNTKNSKNTTLEGKTLKAPEEIKVKYTNQDQVRIKVKGKGALVDPTIASTKVSIVDVVMEGRQSVWAPLLKGDNVIGELHLDMEFVPKK